MIDWLTFALTVIGFVGGSALGVIGIWYARRSDRLLMAIHKILTQGK